MPELRRNINSEGSCLSRTPAKRNALSILDWLQSRPPSVKVQATAAAVLILLVRLCCGNVLSGTITPDGHTRFLQGAIGRECGMQADKIPIVFYHVPKTGGGTIRYLLTNLAKMGDIYVCQQCAKLPQGPNFGCMEANTSRLVTTCGHLYAESSPLRHDPPYDVIAGHYNLGIELMWAPPPSAAPSTVYTLEAPELVSRIIQLRHPTARMRSLYNFQAGTGALHTSFEQFIAGYDDFNRDALWDKFGGRRDAYSGLTIAVLRACGHSCIAQLNEGLLTPAQALETAKGNLDRHFDVVGVTEEMDLFVEMCRRRFYRLRNLGTVVEGEERLDMHVTPERSRREAEAVLEKPEIRRAIAQSYALKLEQELYDHAIAVMRAQWEVLSRCPTYE